jgi:hypothetical protein
MCTMNAYKISSKDITQRGPLVKMEKNNIFLIFFHGI